MEFRRIKLMARDAQDKVNHLASTREGRVVRVIQPQINRAVDIHFTKERGTATVEITQSGIIYDIEAGILGSAQQRIITPFAVFDVPNQGRGRFTLRITPLRFSEGIKVEIRGAGVRA